VQGGTLAKPPATHVRGELFRSKSAQRWKEKIARGKRGDERMSVPHR